MRSIIDMIDCTESSCDTASTNIEIEVEIQIALDDCDSQESDCEEPPSPHALCHWATAAYRAVASPSGQSMEVTLRIVAADEMQDLNKQYRGKNKTTNVLSFLFDNQFEEIAESLGGLLGDIVICHPVVVAEATQQNKSVQDHYAHMVTHGILHLCGFDHQDDEQALQMEALEANILAKHNIVNPYLPRNELN